MNLWETILGILAFAVVIAVLYVWGLKKTTNPNFRDGVNPHIWSDGKEIGWYVYQPEKEDYKVLSEAVKTYLQVFQEPEEAMQMGQKMC